MARKGILAKYREEGRAMVEGWRKSGLSMAAYARQEGIPVRRLALWRKRLGDDRTGEQRLHEQVPGFVQVTTEDHRLSEDGIRVALPNGVEIKVGPTVDPVRLRHIVAALSC